MIDPTNVDTDRGALDALRARGGHLAPEEVEGRLAVVREAESWLGTPYHGNADVKGAGVDCGMLPLRVFSTVGVIEFIDPRPYPMQWSVHQSGERYLSEVLKHAVEIEGPPLPGDLAMFKFGKGWAHGAIVIDWPRIIHANPPGVCRYDDAHWNSTLRRMMPARFFSIWGKR